MPVQSLDSRDPAFITIGQTLSVLNGTNLSIACPVSGIPEPVVTWSRQNKDLDMNGRVVIKDSVLTILRVTNTDTGIYLCKAVNLAGDVTANSNVTVLGRSFSKFNNHRTTRQLIKIISCACDFLTHS